MASILVSVESLWPVHRQRQQPLLCLVRGTADGDEQSATRRAGVRLPAQLQYVHVRGVIAVLDAKPKPLKMQRSSRSP